jgi:hypothetical protein
MKLSALDYSNATIWASVSITIGGNLFVRIFLISRAHAGRIKNLMGRYVVDKAWLQPGQ